MESTKVMEGMEDPEFVKKFDDLYLELTILNYKFRTKFRPFTEKERKSLSYLKLLIPIFKRLQEEGDELEITKILQEHDFPSVPSHQTLQPVSDNSVYQYPPSHYPSAPVIRLPIDTDSDGYNNISEPEESSEDPEGDIQVNTLTEASLTLLSNIQKNNWALVESDVEEHEVEDDDEEDEYEDEEEEEDNNNKCENTFSELEAVPMLVHAN